MKRSAEDVPQSTNKKVLVEPQKIVKVHLLKRNTNSYDDDSDYDSGCENENKSKVYIDVNDEIAAESILFKSIGSKRDYDCVRAGSVKVTYGDEDIGSISFVLISRDELNGLDFWEACDAESGELEQIASTFFKSDGYLKKDLLKYLSESDDCAMANMGCFMYITKISLKSPYDQHCADENVYVAAEAISRLTNSILFGAEDITTTLVMYIPDGWDNVRNRHNPQLQTMDERSFKMAGFKVVPADRKYTCTYMYYEVYPL